MAIVLYAESLSIATKFFTLTMWNLIQKVGLQNFLTYSFSALPATSEKAPVILETPAAVAALQNRF